MKKRTKILLWVLAISFILFVVYRYITYSPFAERGLHEFVSEICW